MNITKTAQNELQSYYNAIMGGLGGPGGPSRPISMPTSYLDRLRERQAKFVTEIHIKQRELATITALIQFLTDRPEIIDVAEKVMEP